MSINSNRSDDSQELDLSAVSKGIGNMFRRLNSFIFDCISFVIRNIILLAIIFIIGAGLGFWMDSSQKRMYRHQIIVTPNFGSVDYLYSKIELIDSKIKENDTVFLKSIGIMSPKDLAEVKIDPIVDVFKFVNTTSNEQNYKMLELMAQDGDLKKIVTENTTSKNYPFHTITFSTRGMTTTEKTVKPLLEYLNNSVYFATLQKEYINNVEVKLKTNDIIIAQIDAVLGEFSRSAESGPKSDKLVYYNENTQLNDVIKSKDGLIREQGLLRVDRVNLSKIVKDSSTTINIKDKESVNGKMKVVLPLLFIFLFLVFFFFRAFYRSQKLKHEIK
jgi:uncharacterized protein YneF (UPF0154 family)